MTIVIAPDSFKECLTAKEVAHHMTQGVLSVFPLATIHSVHISDGGEGLLEAIMNGKEGSLVAVEVLDPLMRKIEAHYGIIEESNTAVIEMAKASGLELLKEEEKNPLLTSTFGTGQLIKDALDRGCKKIIIGIGGSATNDGGTGMVSALGAQFLDKKGVQLAHGGGNLHQLHKIDLSGFDKRIKTCEIIVACDVSNPLTGINGASFVYGEQKGGTKEALKILDRNLAHYGKVIKTTLDVDILETPGAGAAGGTGAALLAFMNGTLINGITLLLETLAVEKYISGADLVITGEGKIDAQTLNGKTIFGVASMAKRHGVPVLVITGKIGENIERIYDLGVSSVFSIVNKPMSLEDAIKNAPKLIENCVRNIMNTIKSINRV